MKIKRVVLVTLLGGAAVFFGYKALTVFLAPPESEEQIRIRKLTEQDPALAQQYAKLKDQREKDAFIATVEYYKKEKIQAIKQLVEDNKKYRDGVPIQKLIEFAMDFEKGSKNQEEFIEAHAAYFEMANQFQTQDLFNQYISVMNELKAAGGNNWEIVQRDPTAIAVYKALEKQEGKQDLWNFYCRNTDWLSPLIADSIVYEAASEEEDDSKSEGIPKTEENLVEWLKTARKVPSVCKTLKNEIEALCAKEKEDDPASLLSMILPMLTLNSSIFSSAEKLKIPLVEVFSILLMNSDQIEYYKEDPVKFLNLRAQKKDIWKWAQSQCGVLQLNRRIPAYSNKIMQDYGYANAATFLLEEYGENRQLLEQAAKSIDAFGDVGWICLQEYSDNEDFKKQLENPKVGFKLIPMIGKSKGIQEALNKIDDNVKWVDRYVDSNGNLKEEKTSFIELCPFVGGIATVANNWAKGYPCEWEEIGWAALDVADTALLVATLGTSAGVTLGGRVAKDGGKIAAKKAIKTTARNALKGAVKKAGKTGKWVKLAKKHPHVFKAMKGMRSVVRFAGKTIRIGGRVAKAGANIIKKPLVMTIKGWNAMSPARKKFFYRVACGLITLYTIGNRTIPGLKDYGPKMIEETIKEIIEAMVTIPKKIVDAIVKTISPSGSKWLEVFVWIALAAIFVFFFIFVWKRKPRRNETFQTV